MNYKGLLEQAERIAQREDTIDHIISYMLFHNKVLYLIIILGIIKENIRMILHWDNSKIPWFIIYTIILVCIIVSSFRNIKNLKDDMNYIISDFYSNNTRKKLLEEEIDSFTPEVLSGEISDYKDLVTFISVGDLCYKVIPYYSSYRVMLYDKNLGEFKSLEEAASFATNRIRKSIKKRLGIL